MIYGRFGGFMEDVWRICGGFMEARNLLEFHQNSVRSHLEFHQKSIEFQQKTTRNQPQIPRNPPEFPWKST